MEVKLKALADFASITLEGKVNILGIFDQVNPPPRLPFVLPQLFLALVWEAGVAEAGVQRKVKTVLLDADGRQVLALDQPLTVPPQRRSGERIQMNQIIGLGGVVLNRTGDYQFSILADGDEKASVPFHVNEPLPSPSGEE